MLKKIGVFILLIVANILIADKTDSLKKQLAVNNIDTTIYKIYLNIGKEFYYNGLMDSSIRYYQAGLEKAIKQNNPKYTCNFNSELGLINREKGLYDIAYDF